MPLVFPAHGKPSWTGEESHITIMRVMMMMTMMMMMMMMKMTMMRRRRRRRIDY